VLLILAPWTQLWERNYFGDLWPWLDVIMENMYARGGVTGVGLVTGWVGVRELASIVMSRWGADEPSVPPSAPPASPRR
jgi:hypothetical protein